MGPHLGYIGNRREKTTTDRIGRLADYRRPIWNSANHRPRQASRKMKTTSVQNEAIQFRDFTGPPRMLRRSTIPVAPLIATDAMSEGTGCRARRIALRLLLCCGMGQNTAQRRFQGWVMSSRYGFLRRRTK
jgi:hypothetical protein